METNYMWYFLLFSFLTPVLNVQHLLHKLRNVHSKLTIMFILYFPRTAIPYKEHTN